MPGAFLQDDLKVLFASSEFGEANDSVTHRGTSGIMGIFDDDDVEITLGEGVAEIAPQPMFTGRTSDFPVLENNDNIVIRGETFRIKNWRRETEIITLFLERVTL